MKEAYKHMVLAMKGCSFVKLSVPRCFVSCLVNIISGGMSPLVQTFPEHFNLFNKISILNVPESIQYHPAQNCDTVLIFLTNEVASE